MRTGSRPTAWKLLVVPEEAAGVTHPQGSARGTPPSGAAPGGSCEKLPHGATLQECRDMRFDRDSASIGVALRDVSTASITSRKGNWVGDLSADAHVTAGLRSGAPCAPN